MSLKNSIPKKAMKTCKRTKDLINDHKNDYKYKTEICKTFSLMGKCPYNKKCRFAHGPNELYAKKVDALYKKKTCSSFEERGFCSYGQRCTFKHQVVANFTTGAYVFLLRNYKAFQKPLKNLRLNVFKSITCLVFPETDTESIAISRKPSVEKKESELNYFNVDSLSFEKEKKR